MEVVGILCVVSGEADVNDLFFVVSVYFLVFLRFVSVSVGGSFVFGRVI